MREFFRGVIEILHPVTKEQTGPSWMSGQLLTQEQIDKLPSLDQLRYEVAHEIFLQGLDPRKGSGGKLFSNRMNQVRSDWLIE